MKTQTNTPSFQVARLAHLISILLFPGCCLADGKLNVLFLVSDDMRPLLISVPRQKPAGARGLVFERAFCQQALCSPSRISLLTGRHPWTTRIYEIGPFLRETMPDVVTLPQHFRNHGHFTRSLGKVYHVGIDDPQSWSVPPWHSKKPRYVEWKNKQVQLVARELYDHQADPEENENVADLPGKAPLIEQFSAQLRTARAAASAAQAPTTTKP